MSEARTWRILKGKPETLLSEMTFAAEIGIEINELIVNQVDICVSKSAYDQLQAKVIKLEADKEGLISLVAELELVRAALNHPTSERHGQLIRERNEWREQCLSLYQKLGLTIGALKGVQACPENFNRDGLDKVIREAEDMSETFDKFKKERR